MSPLINSHAPAKEQRSSCPNKKEYDTYTSGYATVKKHLPTEEPTWTSPMSPVTPVTNPGYAIPKKQLSFGTTCDYRTGRRTNLLDIPSLPHLNVDILSEADPSSEEVCTSAIGNPLSMLSDKSVTHFDKLMRGVIGFIESSTSRLSDEVTTFATNIVLFLVQAATATTWIQYTTMAIAFLNNIVGIGTIKRCVNDVRTHVMSCVAHLRGSQGVTAESFTEEFRAYTASGSKIINVMKSAALFVGLHDLFVRLLAFNFIPKEQCERVIKYAGKPKTGSIMDLVESVLHTVANLFKFGDSVVNSGSITAAFMQPDGPTRFLDRTAVLMSKAENVTVGNALQYQIEAKTFSIELLEHINAGKTLVAGISPYHSSSSQLAIALEKSKKAFVLLRGRLNGVVRTVPLALKIFGSPGIGKSTLLAFSQKLLAWYLGFEYNDNMTYHKPVGTLNYDGYDAGHLFMHLSEVAGMTLDAAKTRGDEQLSQITSILDGDPYLLPMAELSNKGSTFLNILALFMDTNNRSLNARVTHHAPSSVMRRMIDLTLSVKKEYRISGSESLDPAKVVDLENGMDAFTFSGYKNVADGNKRTISVPLFEDVEVDGLVQGLLKIFDEHFRRSDRGTQVKKESILRYLWPRVPSDLDVSTSVMMNFTRPKHHAVAQNLDGEPLEVESTFEGFHDGNTFVPTLGEISPVPQSIIEADNLAGRSRWQIFVGDYISSDSAGHALIERVSESVFYWYKRIIGNSFKELYSFLPSFYKSPLILTTFSLWSVYYFFVTPVGCLYLATRLWCLRGMFILANNSEKVMEGVKGIGDVIARRKGMGAVARQRIFFSRICLRFVGYKVISPLIYTIGGAVELVTGNSSIRRYAEGMRGTSDALRDWIRGKGHVLATNAGNLLLLASGLMALKIAFSLVSSVTQYANAEGGVLSTVTPRTRDEIDKDLVEAHERYGCEQPPARVRSNNARDFELPTFRCATAKNFSKKPTNNRESVVKLIQSNVRTLIMVGETTSTTNVLGVCEDFAIINTHAFPLPKHKDHGSFVMTSSVPGSRTSRRTHHVYEKDFYQLSSDITLFRLHNIQFKNIVEYFPETHIVFSEMGNPAIMKETELHCYENGTLVSNGVRNNNIVHMDTFRFMYPGHAPGLCGNPVITTVGRKHLIAGIHCAGSNGTKKSVSEHECYGDKTGSLAITKGIELLKNRSVLLGVNSEGSIRVPLDCSGIGEVHRSNPILHEEVPGMTVIGEMNNRPHVQPNKSEVCSRIRIFPDIAEITDTSQSDTGGLKYGPPHMRAVKCGDIYKAPFNHYVKQAGLIKAPLDPFIMEQVVEDLSLHVIQKLMLKGVTVLKPYKFEAGINGSDEDQYLRTMKMSTSGGLCWPGSKATYFDRCTLSYKEIAYDPLHSVKEQLLEVVDAYERGENSMSIYGCQLKDEVRSRTKNLEAKTRVFCVSPLESLIVQRTFLLPLYSLMQVHGEIFSSAVGVNMMSDDVNKIMEDINQFPGETLGLEGDFGGYDVEMVPGAMEMGHSVLYNVLYALGYNESALEVVKGIFSDQLFPVLSLNNVLFMSTLVPSGKYATAEGNVIYNLVLIRYWWTWLCNYDEEFALRFTSTDFPKYVHVLFYGDDLLGSAHPQVAKWINNRTYADFCKNYFHMRFTASDKSDTIKEFLKVDEMSFLKRSFRYREDLGRWVAPIARDTLMKCLSWYIPSKVVSKEEQLCETAITVSRELFLHHEEVVFSIKRLQLILMVVKATMMSEPEVSKLFPTFDKIKVSMYGD